MSKTKSKAKVKSTVKSKAKSTAKSTAKRQQVINDEAAAEDVFQAEQDDAAAAVLAERAEENVDPRSIVGRAKRRGRFAYGGIRLRRASSAYDQTTPIVLVDPQLKAQQDKEDEEDERLAQEIAYFMETIKVKYNLVDDDTPPVPGYPRDANSPVVNRSARVVKPVVE